MATSADLFLASTSCFDVLLTTQYEGQPVGIQSRPFFDMASPRLALSAGFAFEAGGVSPELTAGVGTIRTKTEYGGPERDDISWRWWFGTTATVRFHSGIGLQFEVGRHRLAERYYALSAGNLVAEFLRWETMWRVGLTVPVIG